MYAQRTCIHTDRVIIHVGFGMLQVILGQFTQVAVAAPYPS